MVFNRNLEVGKNVYIVLENKLKFDVHNVMEHWYAQDDIIIRCPILNTMTMKDGTVLYNIRFNNKIFQIVDNTEIEHLNNNEIRTWHSDDSGCTVLTYGKSQCNSNGEYKEILGGTPYFAFYKYQDAVKKFRYLFGFRLSKIKDQLEKLQKNMVYINEYIDNDISVNADEYDIMVNKTKF